MIRRLLRTLTIALLCGCVIFVILFVSAWVNLRGAYGFCDNQRFSRELMRGVKFMIEEYQKEHGSLPQKLTALPQVNQIRSTSEGLPADAWERPLQYHPQETSYELFSFGRDGKTGGIGLDADLYLDGRNRELSIVTFSQYLQESDKSEVPRNVFLGVAIESGIFIALITFAVFWMAEKPEDKEAGTPAGQLKLSQLILFTGAIVLISSAVGVFLLPVHISGH